MSDTPRTDANERAVFDNGNANGGYTDADFARQLERENAALREQLAERDAEIARQVGRLKADLTDTKYLCEDYEREIQRARQQLSERDDGVCAALAENVAAFCAEADELMERVTDSRAK